MSKDIGGRRRMGCRIAFFQLFEHLFLSRPQDRDQQRRIVQDQRAGHRDTELMGFGMLGNGVITAVRQQRQGIRKNGRSMHRSWSRTARKRHATFMMPPMWNCVSSRSIRESRPQRACSTTGSSSCSIILNCAVRRQSSPRAGRWSRSATIPLKTDATPPTRNTGNPHRRDRRSAVSRTRCACNMLRFAAILCCLL